MVDVYIVTFWFLLLGSVTSCVVSIRLAGPYDFNVKEISQCKDKGTGQVYFGSKINHSSNGKYIYKEPFRFMVPIDDNFDVYMEVQQWSSQGWRPRAFVYTFRGCQAVDSVLGSFYKSLIKSAGVDITGCPYPTGNYTANHEVKIKLDKITNAIYTKYRVINEYLYKNKKVGCLMVYGETVPKQDTN